MDQHCGPHNIIEHSHVAHSKPELRTLEVAQPFDTGLSDVLRFVPEPPLDCIQHRRSHVSTQSPYVL